MLAKAWGRALPAPAFALPDATGEQQLELMVAVGTQVLSGGSARRAGPEQLGEGNPQPLPQEQTAAGQPETRRCGPDLGLFLWTPKVTCPFEVDGWCQPASPRLLGFWSPEQGVSEGRQEEPELGMGMRVGGKSGPAPHTHHGEKML